MDMPPRACRTHATNLPFYHPLNGGVLDLVSASAVESVYMYGDKKEVRKSTVPVAPLPWSLLVPARVRVVGSAAAQAYFLALREVLC